jgi:hypothetical protein
MREGKGEAQAARRRAFPTRRRGAAGRKPAERDDLGRALAPPGESRSGLTRQWGDLSSAFCTPLAMPLQAPFLQS